MKKSVILLLLISLGLSAFAEEFTGREIVDNNTIVTVSGELRMEHDELYIRTADMEYMVHLGPEEYQSEVVFSKEYQGVATIKGYVLEENLAPQTILYNNKLYRFRDSDGKPMWRGKSYAGGNQNDPLH